MTRDTTLPVGRALIYVAIAATAWGTGGAAAALLYRDSGLGPVSVSFWRFVGGVLLLAVTRMFLRRSDRPRPAPTARSRRDWWRRIIVTGVGLSVYQTAYFAAVGYGGLAIATVVTLGAGPVLIAIGARITMAERLGRAGIATIAMAISGLLLLVGGDGLTTGSAPLLGLVFALLSAVGYAGVTLLSRHMGRKADSDDPYDMALGGFAVGMVCLLPLALIEGILPTGGDPVQTVALLAYLGAVPTALAYGLFFAGLTVVRATTASVVALIEPITAAVIAAVLLHERLTVMAVVGASVLLSAVVVLALAERRTGQAQRAAALLLPRDAAPGDATPCDAAPPDAAPRDAAPPGAMPFSRAR